MNPEPATEPAARVPLDADGTPIQVGSVIQRDTARGVVTHIWAEHDRPNLPSFVPIAHGDLKIHLGGQVYQQSSQHDQWRHIPLDEQTATERIRSASVRNRDLNGYEWLFNTLAEAIHDGDIGHPDTDFELVETIAAQFDATTAAAEAAATETGRLQARVTELAAALQLAAGQLDKVFVERSDTAHLRDVVKPVVAAALEEHDPPDLSDPVFARLERLAYRHGPVSIDVTEPDLTVRFRAAGHLFDAVSLTQAVAAAEAADLDTPAATIEQLINAWRTERWPDDNDDRLIAAKLGEEAGEVLGAAIKIPEGRATVEDLCDEIGDTLIALAALAARHDRTLDGLLRRRWATVAARPKAGS